MYQIVIDTNVIITGLKSRNGASFQLLRRLKDPRWQINLSTALVLEYEEQLNLSAHELNLSKREINEIIDGLCSIARLHKRLSFKWRPLSKDLDDDFILELAIHANADMIISYNKRDLAEAHKYGVQVVTPLAFLIETGDL